MKPFSLELLHRLSFYHHTIIGRPEITKVGCFYCLEVYHKNEIREWVDGGCTCLCARCGIDAVLPTLFMTTQHGKVFCSTEPSVLSQMHGVWFSVENAKALPEEPHPKPDQASHEEPAQDPTPDPER